MCAVHGHGERIFEEDEDEYRIIHSSITYTVTCKGNLQPNGLSLEAISQAGRKQVLPKDRDFRRVQTRPLKGCSRLERNTLRQIVSSMRLCLEMVV